MTFFGNTGRTARMDLGFVSPALTWEVTAAAAPITSRSHVLSGPPKTGEGAKTGRLSDHSPIVVDLRRGPAVNPQA